MVIYTMNGRSMDPNKIDKWACDNCKLTVPAKMPYTHKYTDMNETTCPKCHGTMKLQEQYGKVDHVIKSKKYKKEQRKRTRR